MQGPETFSGAVERLVLFLLKKKNKIKSITGCAFKAKIATKAALLALPIRSFRIKQVFCAAIWQQSLV